MDARTAFKGRFIAAAELPEGKTPTLTVRSVEVLALEDDKGQAMDRLIIWFLEIERGFVCNKTNMLCVAAMFGYETEAWVGKRITIRRELVQLGRERVPGIRIEGSPDIGADIQAEIKLPKKKAKTVTLRRTGAPATPGKEE